MDGIFTLREWIAESDNIVFFGGAGVSTESGIPDFRGENGMYRQEREIPLELILSHDYFMAHPEGFYSQLRGARPEAPAQPNVTHYRLAELERQGKLRAIITQNADGLHQAAGSKTVYELHGNSTHFSCVRCGKQYPDTYVYECEGDVPYCDCGGFLRPDAVLFGEALDSGVIANSIKAIREADVLIVGGTSLLVYPAAGLIDFYRGRRLVLINESATHRDGRADLLIPAKLGEVFSVV